jgi:lauroyl/myristoyl acyltransferase
MESLLYWFARGVIGFIQALPLRSVARLGRAGGAMAYYLDGRHRRVALANLQASFGENYSGKQLQELARENFCRIGESYACAVKTAGMSFDELKQHVTFVAHHPEVWDRLADGGSFVAAVGHFGNFELYARFGQFLPRFKTATTYRGLKQASLNRLLQQLREKSGCLFFERRSEGAALRQLMSREPLAVGFLADQNAGDKGLRLPFFGRDCSTSPAPALFALRYRSPLVVGFCQRTGLAQWRIEMSGEIETSRNGEPRTAAEIMLDVNRAFEELVRRDPANWFWVHNRWKNPGRLPKHFNVADDEGGAQ